MNHRNETARRQIIISTKIISEVSLKKSFSIVAFLKDVTLEKVIVC